MVLENNEYIVSKVGVPDQSITILKSALEKWRDHYELNALKITDKADKERCHNGKFNFKYGYYLGKRDVLKDLLKMFEELEG